MINYFISIFLFFLILSNGFAQIFQDDFESEPTPAIVVSSADELNTALNNVSDGETILLRTANYGALSITNRRNQVDITLAADSGHTPRFTRVTISNSSHWIIRGVQIRPTAATAAAVSLAGTELTFENSSISFADHANGWTASDWVANTASGIAISGSHLSVVNNQITFVNHGISGDASHSLVSGNTIDSFRGDGMRGLGDHTVWEYNTVKNCYDVDDNHDDGFQSWSVGPGGVGTGTVTGVILRGNRIINYENPNQSFRCTLQGVGLFDGTFVDWVIENNVIITDHWHGITALGADNVKIINNTVINPVAASRGPPWIMIEAHKNGTLPVNSVVRNNIATDFDNASSGVTVDHNLEISSADFDQHFIDESSNNLQLKSGSSAIDAGSSLLAPMIDISGRIRPQGSAIDIGAYEY